MFSGQLHELFLHEVCALGDAGKLEELGSFVRKSKLDVNIRDEDWKNKTALHWAAGKGHARCVKLLLEYGANPGAKMVGGWTPAHCAAETGRYNVLKVLVDHHAPVTLPDDSGDTPKRVAEIYGHTDCLELLCSAETNENQRKHFVKDKFRSQTRKISRMVDTKDQQAPAVLD
ncbi:ankyrin repeat domain-containing protein 66 isoform X1 [Nematostella vectensis]|uniref:ankyrin repeat domain-containing protein 66 isoform X1 n=1 Tax=Nematostella vectensis TaxID=45351 RepID=UPI001390486C|nr:ankyrin repeat domain-containing protein 66 isoform X1 [Nematostella vectensis]